MTRVGLIGPPDREELARLAIRLEERGAEAVLLDSRQDPRIRLDGDGTEACGVDLAGLRAIFVSDLGVRSPWVRGEDERCDLAGSRRALASSRRQLAAWNALLERLARTRPVINPPRTHDLHALKPWEMAVYELDELPVPETMATTDANALREVAGGGGPWIEKGMVGGYGYTEAFAVPDDELGARALVAERPRMIQRRVEGDNVRAFVIGGEVVGAAEIVSTAGDATDSRRGEKRVRRVELPAETTRAAVTAARRWGMEFCAADFMREASTGRHLLLECNSSPFFVNFERASGCDISSPLADLLLGRRPAAREA